MAEKMSTPAKISSFSSLETETPRTTFFSLPLEIRYAIYEEVAPQLQPRSVYFDRNIYLWRKKGEGSRCPAILLVCKQIYAEASTTLLGRMELKMIYSDHAASASSATSILVKVCGLEEYTNVLQIVDRLQLTLFIGSTSQMIGVVINLLGWIKTVLAERDKPMRQLTVTFCATHWKTESRPSALVYAAQGLQMLCPTEFVFQCGFSGQECMAAREVLGMGQHKPSPTDRPVVSKESAFQAFAKAWGNSHTWWVVQILTHCLGMLKWLGTLCGW